MNDFDQKAREWDKNKMHMERTIAVAGQLQNMVSSRPGIKAMEFGAGTGLLSFYLKELFSEITLVDSSLEMLKVAKQKMQGDDQLKFKTLFIDLETEAWNEESFDIIYSQMVLHHIGDTKAILKKFYDLLNPGGLLAVADLYLEDGSFHDGATDILPGFDTNSLETLLVQQGFHDCRFEPCFVMRKEKADGTVTEYPVFLLTALR